MNVIPFEPEHVGRIALQECQRTWIPPDSYLRALQAGGPSLTAEDQGRILACAGIAIQWPGVGALWSFVSRDAGPHMIRLDRCVRRLLDIPQLRRIEASAAVDFAPGCRWLELLGFEREHRMRKYGPNGEDHMLYSRVS